MSVEWPTLLRQISARLFEITQGDEAAREMTWLQAAGDDPDRAAEEAEKRTKSRWLGFAGASEEEIAARERELGVKLPEDYKAFLRASNGFLSMNGFPHGISTLSPVQEIGWLRDLDNGRLEAYAEEFGSRDEDDIPDEWFVSYDEFESTLLIGDSDGNECILLKPPGPGPETLENGWQVWLYDPEAGIKIFDDSPHTFLDFMSRGLSSGPTALQQGIEQLLEKGDPRLPKVATWAAERADIDLLQLLMDDYIVHCNLRTVEAIKATLPSTGEALTKRIATMLEHKAPEERRAGALFAGLLGLNALAPRLVAALDDPYFLTRMEAAKALGALRHLPAVEELRLSLGDDDILTRGAAIEALTVIPDPDLLTAYTGRITVDPPIWERGAFDDAAARSRAHAILVLRKHRPPCAREALSFYVREFEVATEDAETEAEAAEEKQVLELARSVLAEL